MKREIVAERIDNAYGTFVAGDVVEWPRDVWQPLGSATKEYVPPKPKPQKDGE